MGVRKEMMGKTFNQLTVIGFAGKDSGDHLAYNCLCSCGREAVVRGIFLRIGKVKKCPYCSKRYMHGLSHTRTYRTWWNLVNRCTNPGNKDFKHYGGRGITICGQWLTFEAFIADMGERPEGLEIDRIDNSKGYSKENCRWVTHSDNLRNRRSWKGRKHERRHANTLEQVSAEIIPSPNTGCTGEQRL